MHVYQLMTDGWRDFRKAFYWKSTPPVIIHSHDFHDFSLGAEAFHYGVRYYHDMMLPPVSEWIVPNTLDVNQ